MEVIRALSPIEERETEYDTSDYGLTESSHSRTPRGSVRGDDDYAESLHDTEEIRSSICLEVE